MKNGFADCDHKIPCRPKFYKNEFIAKSLAEEYAPKVLKWNQEEETDLNLKEIQSLLEKVFFNSFGYEDGYYFCTKLDNEGLWDCDSKLVEILDNVCSDGKKYLNKCIEDWVTAYQIVPRFKIGDGVLFKTASKESSIGVIKEIGYKNAFYYIHKTGDSDNCNCVIKFEDTFVLEDNY
jgi:hypothetical protein